jgi:hypothetical protein
VKEVVQPETRYARLGGDRIAYQVLGQGPPDLVMAVGVTIEVVPLAVGFRWGLMTDPMVSY